MLKDQTAFYSIIARIKISPEPPGIHVLISWSYSRQSTHPKLWVKVRFQFKYAQNVMETYRPSPLCCSCCSGSSFHFQFLINIKNVVRNCVMEICTNHTFRPKLYCYRGIFYCPMVATGECLRENNKFRF